MKTFIKSAALFTAAATLPAFASPAFAGDMSLTEAPAMAKDHAMMKDHSFAKKSFKINGDYSIVTENGQTLLRLSDDFKTKSGPDLKIFLSPQSTDAVTGQTATQGAIKLGALKTNKGGSDYAIPAGVNLANYQSVLIHCEAYSKLWGAAEL